MKKSLFARANISFAEIYYGRKRAPLPNLKRNAANAGCILPMRIRSAKTRPCGRGGTAMSFVNSAAGKRN